MTTREHPILFSGEMVRAILDGRKSQTRRVVKLNPAYVERWKNEPAEMWARECPYGQPGDRLWVRETFGLGQQSYNHTAWITYRAGGERDANDRYTEVAAWQDRNPRCWYPSIHMPRWASRITLEVTGVRVERVQAITNEDAIAEGCTGGPGVEGYSEANPADPYEEYAILWDSLNADRGFGWNVNPWVWRIAFRRVAP